MAGDKGSALGYAYRLLGYRGRSERELARRLKLKGFEAAEIEKTLDRLKSMGLLDDGLLASSLGRTASETKMLGKRGAEAFLLQRGIDKGLIKEALDGYEEEEAASRLVNKKMRTMKGVSTEEAGRKIALALRRRGFSAETIRKALKTREVMDK